MEQDLNQYIVNEFCKLQSDVEQRSSIENFRFLIMLNDFDFENYYSNKVLRKTDFYFIADMLYQLNNVWMLSTFIYQNRHVPFSKVKEITMENRKPDFFILFHIIANSNSFMFLIEAFVVVQTICLVIYL